MTSSPPHETVFSRMAPGLRWLLRRPAVLGLTVRRLGWKAALQLSLIRLLGKAESIYRVSVPSLSHPVAIRGGGSSDAFALYELLVQREYEPVGDLVAPALIIDGGANVGIASLFFLNRYPTARVIAVEPEPGNFAVCQKNLAPYGDRAKVIQGAIWKSAGHLTIDPRPQEWSMRVKVGESGTIPAYTMQSLLDSGGGEADLLKMDIEGSELEVFGDGAQEWLPRVRNIAIELHSKECRERFFGALDGYRYDLLRHLSPDKRQDWTYVVFCRNLRAPESQTSR